MNSELRFSLKELLAIIGLLALGIVLLWGPFRSWFQTSWYVALSSIGWYLGGAAIGAAIFMPFGKTRIGAVVGLVIQCVALLAFAIISNAIRRFH